MTLLPRVAKRVRLHIVKLCVFLVSQTPLDTTIDSVANLTAGDRSLITSTPLKQTDGPEPARGSKRLRAKPVWLGFEEFSNQESTPVPQRKQMRSKCLV